MLAVSSTPDPLIIGKISFSFLYQMPIAHEYTIRPISNLEKHFSVPPLQNHEIDKSVYDNMNNLPRQVSPLR